MPPRILIVDDEQALVKGLRFRLEQEGYVVSTAYDGEEALAKAESEDPHVIILDLMLPKVDGMTVCRRLRERSDVPIIMLTARGDDVDKILGLEFGADDYVTKPFNVRELVARIKAILRRTAVRPEAAAGRWLERGGLRIDLTGRRVLAPSRAVPTGEAGTAEGEPGTAEGESGTTARESGTVGGTAGAAPLREVALTPTEFDLLVHLARHPGRVFTREELLQQVWGYDYLGDLRTVDVHIRRLREKIEPNPTRPHFILTRWGVGYYFRETP